MNIVSVECVDDISYKKRLKHTSLLRFIKQQYQKASVFDASDANPVRKLRVFVASVATTEGFRHFRPLSLPGPYEACFSGPLGGKKGV